jgi:hypothetical protein
MGLRLQKLTLGMRQAGAELVSAGFYGSLQQTASSRQWRSSVNTVLVGQRQLLRR